MGRCVGALMCMAGLFLALGCGSIDVSSGSAPGGCGDGVCESFETWDRCPGDCPDPALCGGGTCQEGEAQRCAKDCAAPAVGATCVEDALDDGEACDCGPSVTMCTSEEQDILGELQGGPVLSAVTCADADSARPYGLVRCVDCSLRLQGGSDTY
jgi:hypothetical protein